MKKITFLLLFIFCGLTYAQTLQAPTIPADGVTYDTATTNYALTAPFGDAPWDFSFINTNDLSQVSLEPIEGSGFSTDVYPNTTHIKYSPDVVQYPGFSENGYTYNGENSIINAIYPVPLTLMPYPFAVGDTHTDVVTNIPFTCTICPPSMFRAHSVTTEALASGSIILPGDLVFENVILIMQVAEFNDGQTGSATCDTTRTSYFWWSQDHGIPLLETYTQDTSGACDFPSVSFTRVFVEALPFNGGGGGSVTCPEEYELPIVWQETFECQDSFAIENFDGWTAIDGDMENTWGASSVDFANESYTGSGIIWNHDEAAAVDGADISDWAPYDGARGLYFFDAQSDVVQNDDWMISPELTIQGIDAPILSFWAKSVTSLYGLENFRVAVGNFADSEDYTLLSSENEVAPTEWTEYQYDLSEYIGQNLKIGIHFIGDPSDYDSFVLMMDSFKVEGTLGVNDLDILQMSLYPNPVEGNYVTINTPSIGIKYVEVFDIMGKRLIETSLINDNLDVSDLNSGIYLVKVTVGIESKTTKLIIN